MKEKNSIKDKWLHVRLSGAEREQLDKAFSKTTERKMSGYLRKVLLGEPIIKGYRDLASDDLIREFSVLLRTLNGIGNNLNQSVHKLHTMEHFAQVKSWLELHQKDTETILDNIGAIKEHLKNFSAKWLQ